jgi:hypothetical protein
VGRVAGLGVGRRTYPPTSIFLPAEREPAKSNTKPKFLQNTRDNPAEPAKPRQMLDQPAKAQILSLDKARERRDREETRRLEQLVIERWTGPRPKEEEPDSA